MSRLRRARSGALCGAVALAAILGALVIVEASRRGLLASSVGAAGGRDPLPPATVDLCAARRPDGTLPAACASSPTQDDEATILFAGDTGEVDAALPIIEREREGYDHPYGATAALVRSADLAVANLEAPITDGGDASWRWRRYSYSAPAASAEALGRAGFDLLGLANNHVMDRGATGLADTLRNITAAGLTAVGAGEDAAAARRGVIVRLGALRVAFIARCEWQLAWELWLEQYARGGLPGVALLDDKTLERDIAGLRAQADLVVLLVHWGENYAAPTGSQLEWAHRAARAGADLVVGHHPHVAQALLLDGETPIALSLGNYAFGTTGHPKLDAGILLMVHVHARRIDRLELLPIDVQNRRVRFRPTLLVADAAAAALSPIVEASRRAGTPLVVHGDRAVLDLSSLAVPTEGTRSGARK